jgi:MerR family transcriptional regulator, copper efflux regulator
MRDTMNRTIGVLANEAGVGIQAIRFYEREGLIAAPARTRSGYRIYNDEVVGRLRFIRRAQELGFTLKEIRELIALEDSGQADCNEVYTAASAKVAAVQAKIDDLTRMKDELAALVQSCSATGTVRQCAIIQCLHSA